MFYMSLHILYFYMRLDIIWNFDFVERIIKINEKKNKYTVVMYLMVVVF